MSEGFLIGTWISATIFAIDFIYEMTRGYLKGGTVREKLITLGIVAFLVLLGIMLDSRKYIVLVLIPFEFCWFAALSIADLSKCDKTTFSLSAKDRKS